MELNNPPPIVFPDYVDSARGYFDERVVELIAEPPVLTAAQIAELSSTPDVAESISRGRGFMLAGRVCDAAKTLEPAILSHPHAAALCGLCMYALGRAQRAILIWETMALSLPADVPPSLYQSLVNLGRWMIKENGATHPEADAFTMLCEGRGIDVGCGGNKTCPGAIGVDLTPGGAAGVHGGQRGVTSGADVIASGDYMPMFGDGTLDYVIARHNLEHYKDYLRAIFEWRRVLRPGGLLGVAVPDHDSVDTIRLDPTHFHVFTKDSLTRIFSLIPGLRLITVSPLIPRWSVMVIAQKPPCDAPFDYTAAVNTRERERALAKMEYYKNRGATTLAEQCAMEAELVYG